MPDVAPDGEAKAADDDERHDGEIHDRVCRVAAEAPAYVCIRKHVKARVAERGDRVEHAVPQSLSEAELRQEAEKQNERPRPLACRISDRHRLCYIGNIKFIIKYKKK